MNCPICKQQSVSEYRPFCSKRCADVDLGRWLDQKYSIVGEGEIGGSDATGAGALNGKARTD